jgi:hypothetical protein
VARSRYTTRVYPSGPCVAGKRPNFSLKVWPLPGRKFVDVSELPYVVSTRRKQQVSRGAPEDRRTATAFLWSSGAPRDSNPSRCGVADFAKRSNRLRDSLHNAPAGERARPGGSPANSFCRISLPTGGRGGTSVALTHGTSQYRTRRGPGASGRRSWGGGLALRVPGAGAVETPLPSSLTHPSSAPQAVAGWPVAALARGDSPRRGGPEKVDTPLERSYHGPSTLLTPTGRAPRPPRQPQ